MKYLLTSREMKQVDNNTIENFGIPSMVLMERASLQVVQNMEAYHLTEGRICVLCGSGNNGGDGFAVARLLHLKGCDVSVFFIGNKEKLTKDCKKQWEICHNYQLPISEDEVEFSSCDVIVDAIFGVGLCREIEGNYAKVISQVNDSDAIKVAIDIPSGISADDGCILGCAVKADYTITFGFEKVGQSLYPGKSYCGKVILTDIGITEHAFCGLKPLYRCLEKKDLHTLPKTAAIANKGSQGKVLLIAGSDDMAGAAYLAAHSALVTGCGMVKVYTSEKNRNIILSRLPEAIIVCYDKFDEKECIDLMQWADVIAIGPGLGSSTLTGKLVSCVLENASVPLVVDADALNFIAEHPEILRRPHTEMIVTPHVGEMARLTSNPTCYIAEHKMTICRDFSQQYQVICVLKDASTTISIPYGDMYIHAEGTEGMATAGSGDVLTGIIASLIAQGVDASMAAPLGVLLHGLSGKEAAKENSIHGMVASDIMQGIKNIYIKRGL